MIDWLSEHAWVTWTGIAVFLAVIEMMSLDLVLLMFALGALGAAVAAAFGAPFWLAIAIFAIIALALLLLVRPPLVEKLHSGPTLSVGHEAQVGRTAVVTEPVTTYGGRVRLSGEIWSARSDSEAEKFDTGTEVQVTRIDGATAVVTAKEN